MFSFIRLALILCALHLVFLFNSNSIVLAVELHAGDVIVDAEVDDGAGKFALLRIDASTGARTVISSKDVGSCPVFTKRSFLAMSPTGQIYAGSGNQVFRIDPATGDRTIVSDATHGNGLPEFGRINALQTLPDGSLLVCSEFYHLARVDPLTGNRTALPPQTYDPPQFFSPGGLTLAANGEVWIADNTSGGALRYDVDTGEHHVVSRSFFFPMVGTGPSLSQSFGQSFNLSGDSFFVLQNSNLLRIDPATGNREVASSWDPSFSTYGLRLQTDGSFLTHDSYYNFLRIHPVTGDRSIQFSFDPAEWYISGDFLVVPQTVPEPSTLALAMVGSVALLAMAIRRRASV